MILKNTSRYSTDEVRQLLTFGAEGRDLRRVAVNIKNSQHAYAGMAYERVPRIANVAPSARYLVTLRIGAPDKFPVDNFRSSWVDMPEYDHVPDRGFVEDVLGIEYDSAAFRDWWRCHRIWSCRRGGVVVKRVQKRIYHPYGGKGSPFIKMNDWREGLVALAAHEFTHIHQYQNNLPRSEVQAETIAAARLDLYRKVG